MIYTRTSGLLLRLTIYLAPADTICASGAPVFKYYFHLRRRIILKDCQLVVFFTFELLLPIYLSHSKKIPRCGDVHSTGGQLILSQMLSRCLILATVMLTNGSWHRSSGGWLLDEYRLLRGCWLLLDECWLRLGCWLLVVSLGENLLSLAEIETYNNFLFQGEEFSVSL